MLPGHYSSRSTGRNNSLLAYWLQITAVLTAPITTCWFASQTGHTTNLILVTHTKICMQARELGQELLSTEWSGAHCFDEINNWFAIAWGHLESWSEAPKFHMNVNSQQGQKLDLEALCTPTQKQAPPLLLPKLNHMIPLTSLQSVLDFPIVRTSISCFDSSWNALKSQFERSTIFTKTESKSALLLLLLFP